MAGSLGYCREMLLSLRGSYIQVFDRERQLEPELEAAVVQQTFQGHIQVSCLLNGHETPQGICNLDKGTIYIYILLKCPVLQGIFALSLLPPVFGAHKDIPPKKGRANLLSFLLQKKDNSQRKYGSQNVRAARLQNEIAPDEIKSIQKLVWYAQKNESEKRSKTCPNNVKPLFCGLHISHWHCPTIARLPLAILFHAMPPIAH